MGRGRRPYRVFLPHRLRKVTFATCERAVRAALGDADTTYVVEHREGGHWHPTTVVIVAGGRERWRGTWEQHRDRQLEGASRG